MSNTFVTPYAAVPRVGGLDVAYPWTFTVNGKIFQQAFDEMHPVSRIFINQFPPFFCLPHLPFFLLSPCVILITLYRSS